MDRIGKYHLFMLTAGVFVSLHLADFIPDINKISSQAIMEQHDTFPRLEARTLAKENMIFPDDLREKKTLVLLVFEDAGRYEKAQNEALTWQELWDNELNEIGFYEIPMMSAKYRWIRFWADSGMRSGIAQEKWDNVACFYGNKTAYAERLGIKDFSKAQVFLLGDNGQILYQTSGYLTKEKREQLKKLL